MATLTTSGAIPTSPTVLRDAMVAAATVLAPGLTANLPGSLIEDMASTAAGALVVQDQAYVDLVNSIGPATANDFILTQLGNVYGVAQGVGSNASVYVIFSGTVGFVINRGFIVSDGTHQYTVQESTIIPTGGTAPPVYCVASVFGTWAIPAGTVATLITSVPGGVTLSCTNPSAGAPGTSAQTTEEYRLQVVQAGRAVATGLPTLLKTALQQVAGVERRLISVRPTAGGYQIIVGFGDPYSVAGAIFQSMFNILNLKPAASTGTTHTITVYDYPDSYSIVYVTPAQQIVGVSVNWTTAVGTNFVSNTVVAGAVQPALTAYINSIFVGQGISVLELQSVFLAATVGIIDPINLSSLTFAVTINATPVAPPSGGVLISGDPEGYFYTVASNIIVTNV